MEETIVPVTNGQSSHAKFGTEGQGASNGAYTMMRAGRKTYFFNLRESKNGNKYLLVTESNQDQNGQGRHSSILLFPDKIEEFQQKLSEAAAQL